MDEGNRYACNNPRSGHIPVIRSSWVRQLTLLNSNKCGFCSGSTGKLLPPVISANSQFQYRDERGCDQQVPIGGGETALAALFDILALCICMSTCVWLKSAALGNQQRVSGHSDRNKGIRKGWW